jgi:hypothetical protein
MYGMWNWNVLIMHSLTNPIQQSPSSEAHRSSATQEIPHVLWNPKVHYRIHKSPPVRFRGLCVWFITCLRFYSEELLAPRPIPNPKPEGHPLSPVRNCLFNIFAATIRIWRPLLHPQPEDTPHRGDRNPLLLCSGLLGCSSFPVSELLNGFG